MNYGSCLQSFLVWKSHGDMELSENIPNQKRQTLWVVGGGMET
jgi:hypothetical protein